MVTNTKSRQSQSQRSSETGDQPASPKHDVPSVSSRKGMTGADLLKAARPTNRMATKQQLMTTVAQTLAEVVDIQAGDVEQNARAEELASSAAFQLFAGQANGLLTADEVTQILGNQFGWRKKGDAKSVARNIAEQSKTPFGYGETIRKRITRAVKAHTFAHNPDWEGDNFFKPFQSADNGRETVRELIESVNEGELSIFTLYNNLDDERRELTANDEAPVNAAYDPKKVLRIVQKLTEEGAVEAFAQNPALLIVYASMTEAIEAITDALMARPDADSIIAAVQAAPTVEVEAAE